MNESQTNSTPPNNLAGQITSLQRQVTTLLIALIVVSGTLAVYLCYQSRVLGKDIQAIKPQATPIIQAFNQNRDGMGKFVQQLIAYGQTHPDFQPVLQKYGIIPVSAASNPASRPVPKK
jgi:hypothetical protein